MEEPGMRKSNICHQQVENKTTILIFWQEAVRDRRAWDLKAISASHLDGSISIPFRHIVRHSFLVEQFLENHLCRDNSALRVLLTYDRYKRNSRSATWSFYEYYDNISVVSNFTARTYERIYLLTDENLKRAGTHRRRAADEAASSNKTQKTSSDSQAVSLDRPKPTRYNGVQRGIL